MTWMTKQLIVLVVAIAIMAGVAGIMPCIAESSQNTSQSEQKALASVETITVSGDGDKAELVIKLSAPATYTSYKTTSPLRLIIDLSQTTQGAISAPVELRKGNFKNVVVSRFDTDAGVLTRLDIELVKDADAILFASQAKPGEIRVSFPSLSAQAATSNTSRTAAQSTPVTSAKVDTLTPVAASGSENASMPDDIKESTDVSLRTLTAVSVKDNAIILAIDGGADEFKTFRLNKPERFVVDLFNVKSALASRITSINSLGVSSARLGVYPNKVRIVFDTMNGTFPEASAVKSTDGVTISLKSLFSKENQNSRPLVAPKKEALPEPLKQNKPLAKEVPISQPVAETPLVAAKPALREDLTKATARSGAAVVEMIDFQVIDGISRVAVKVTGDVLVDAPTKSPGFVTLTIKNAVLPKKLQRSLDAKGFVSPVLRVTPLLVKSRRGTDTKIRVAMRKSVPFEYRQEGDMLFIDFKNPEGMTADRVYSDVQTPRSPTARFAKESSNKDVELGSALASQAEPTVKPLGSSKLYKGRKVTLEFADAEVRKIFQLLSEVSNKNFVLGDDVTGSISIKLVNVPWDQALDIILDAKGLDKREDGNIIIIKGKGKFRSQAEEDQELKKAKLKATELETQMFNINYAALDDIVTQFKSMMTEGVGASINKDTRTNKIIVKDIPQAIRSMREILKDLDVPEKQVMIEARIIEASSSFTRSLGVNWGVHYRDGTGSFLGISGLDTGFGGMTTAAPTSGTGTTAGGNMGISFGTLASNIELDLRLSAAASANLIKIVSTPKVATLNNKTAKITQGQQIPYTSSTSDKVETKFIEAALALEVTPHININGTISMKIDAKNDSMGEVPTGSTAPAINKKQATTEMLLRDGETTVIGGIFVDSDNDSDDGVPFLMDIPMLGKLFKTSTKIKTKNELLIFITPRILGTI
jgi:type IV pilus assembly protein PilQ